MFFNFKQFDHHCKLLKTSDFNKYQGFHFLFFIQLIPGYFNKFIYEIMNEISQRSPQLWSIKPAIILDSFGVNSWKPVILGNFLQRKGDFNYRNAIFSTFTSWKWIFTKVLNHKRSTIKNSQPSHDKFYVKFVKAFSGLFCINITWHHVNLNIKCFFLMIPPAIYSK